MGETKKRSGRFELSCGHEVAKPIDVEKRIACPTCQRDAIVVRVIR